ECMGSPLALAAKRKKPRVSGVMFGFEWRGCPERARVKICCCAVCFRSLLIWLRGQDLNL
ncbi:hypothetical protein, partial [Phyllobacterium lublinensis]|uniref:hypothetical protein n=1 Tax=Phyllobacterium lublinensis TaxID=2875708 RepID=UPI001CCC0C12